MGKHRRRTGLDMPEYDPNQIGYRNPSKHYHYPKGTTGNPRGRPPKKIPADLEAAIEDVLSEDVIVKTKNGKTAKKRLLELTVEGIINAAMKGAEWAFEKLEAYSVIMSELRRQKIEQEERQFLESVMRETAKWSK